METIITLRVTQWWWHWLLKTKSISSMDLWRNHLLIWITSTVLGSATIIWFYLGFWTLYPRILLQVWSTSTPLKKCGGLIITKEHASNFLVAEGDICSFTTESHYKWILYSTQCSLGWLSNYRPILECSCATPKIILDHYHQDYGYVWQMLVQNKVVGC
jgi:hypothetical protein